MSLFAVGVLSAGAAEGWAVREPKARLAGKAITQQARLPSGPRYLGPSSGLQDF